LGWAPTYYVNDCWKRLLGKGIGVPVHAGMHCAREASVRLFNPSETARFNSLEPQFSPAAFIRNSTLRRKC
jgi:hypothetical protein